MALKSTVYVGDIRQNNLGEKFTVIEWIDSHNVTVQFEDGTVKKTTNSSIRTGSVENPMFPSVQGRGFYGHLSKEIIDNFSEIDIKHVYTVWLGMMNRCYSENRTQQRIAYSSCQVDPTWYNFSVFAHWYLIKQNYCGTDDYHLDKDLLGDGKLYSPDTCCLLPRDLNQSLQQKKKSKYNLLPGVTLSNGRFKSQLNTLDGKVKHLGMFDDEQKAHEAYMVAKKDIWKQLYEKYKDNLSRKVLSKLTDILKN